MSQGAAHKRLLVLWAIGATTLFGYHRQVSAATYYWDANGDGTRGGDGTWVLGTTTPKNWWDAATGGNAVDWANGNTADFRGIGGTVTISGTVSATGVTFTTSGYQITGGTLNFTTGSITATASGTISANILSIISGGGNLNKLASAGTLTLSGANTFDGATTIGSGGLSVASIGSWAAGNTTASNLGSPTTSTKGTIYFGSAGSTGTLIYTGGSYSTNRNITLNANAAGGGTIQNDGSGALVFTGSVGSINTTVANTKTLTLQGSNTDNNEIQGSISDFDTDTKTAVTKAQAGRWILGGTNTYTGATTVNAGTLLINGSTASGSPVTVNGGTLGGTGTIGGSVTITSGGGGVLAPGASIESLDVSGDVTLNNGTLKIQVNGTGAGSSDLLAVGGALSIGSAAVDFSQIVPVDDAAYVFASYSSLSGGAFASTLNVPANYMIDYNYNGNQIALVAVPEPATVCLSAGVVGLVLLRRRA